MSIAQSVHRAHAAAHPGDSQNIVIGANGTNGNDGPTGTPGSEDMGPGGGQDGQGGGGSLNIAGHGSHLVFSKTAPLGAWTVSVTSGGSGSGGRGGDGGIPFFSGDPGLPQFGANGGRGGDGGTSGEAIAMLHSKLVFGLTGTAAGTGIAISVDAIGGNGGNGGNGGSGSSGGFDSFGGFGGNAGIGGGGGGALATFTNGVLKPTIASKPNVFNITLDLAAHAGDGGDGGQGGLGGFGMVPSPDGNSGAGGSGGSAEMDLVQNVFHLNLAAAHSTTTLTLIAEAVGGDGSDGGPPASGSGGGAGGNGGNALAVFTNNTIFGGGADDLVRIAVNATGGAAGIGGDGVHGSAGTSSVSFGANSFEGGAGNNTLAFSWDSYTTASYIVCDLAAGELYVGSAVKNTIQDFQNITGGSGDDRISGDNTANKLVGGQGDDSINGLRGKDIIKGGAGSDFLDGGAGKDTFVYKAASDSTSIHRDIIDDFDFALDKIDVPFKVTGIGHVLKEALSTATFDQDLAAHVDAGHLLAHHAMLVTAQGGDLDGRMYLVIDANGKTGYQAGGDLVIEVSAPSHVGMLSVDTFV